MSWIVRGGRGQLWVQVWQRGNWWIEGGSEGEVGNGVIEGLIVV